ELDEAKLTLLGRMDTPLSAADEGMGRFRVGITDEMKQERRERLTAVTLDSVEAAANRYLVGRPSARAILGPADEALHPREEWSRESVN
ncbi:Mitochondrial presequence protease, partial [Cladochytrium tenue]